MNASPLNLRKSLWYFLPIGIIISLALAYMASNFRLPANGVRAANAQPPELSAQADNIFVLPKGQAQPVGRVIMTYEGLKTGRIVINITPVDIDSGYTYRRDIPINAAEKGFWLARQYYKLVSAGRAKLEIIRIKI